MAINSIARRFLWSAALSTAAFVAFADEPPIRLGRVDHVAMAPRIATASDGTAYLLWLEKSPAPAGSSRSPSVDLYVARWSATDATPSPAVRVNAIDGEVQYSPVIRPQIAIADDGSVHVLYPAYATSPVHGRTVVDIHYSHSVDRGAAFSRPITLNSPSQKPAGAQSPGGIVSEASFPALVTGPDRRVLAFWLDSRHVTREEDPSDVYAAVSIDNGRTWLSDRRLFGGQVCECCQPVAVRGADAVLLSSRALDGDGHRDPIVNRVAFDLASIGAPVRIGTNRWQIDGCPMKATVLGTDGANAYVAWYSHADSPQGIWFAVSRDGGRSFDAGRPLHPAGRGADAPAIAIANDGHIAVAWQATTGERRQIFVTESVDGGRSFDAPRAVSDGKEAAAGPAIGCDGRATVLAWQQGQAVYASRTGGKESKLP